MKKKRKYDRRKKISRLEFIKNLAERSWSSVEYLFPKDKKNKYSNKKVFSDILLDIMYYDENYKKSIFTQNYYNLIKRKLKYWKKIKIWEDVWDIILQFFLVEVKLSSIHGRGLFSKTYIPRGIFFIEYYGDKYKKSNSRNIARFINNSCYPNCMALENKKNELWILSLVSIPVGKEITINYDYELKGYKKRPCNCGAKDCIGYIVSLKYFKKVRELEGLKKEDNDYEYFSEYDFD